MGWRYNIYKNGDKLSNKIDTELVKQALGNAISLQGVRDMKNVKRK